MTDIEFSPLSEQVHIIVGPAPEGRLSFELEEEVETIWQQERTKFGLFDTLLFSVSSFTEQKIVGHFVHYRYYIASQKSKALQEALQIYPLKTSALCICRNHLLVGLRDTTLMDYPGFMECVPTGYIEARSFMHQEVDFVGNIMWKLQQEARLTEKSLREVHTLGLYYQPEIATYDIGLTLKVDLLEQEMEIEGTKEYPLLSWYSFKEFEEILRQPSSKIVPLSCALWQNFQK